jgi:hypothetical protein
VVPVDVYLHYYSARNQTALTALHEIFAWAMRQELAPMFASEYVDVVRDALWARIGRTSDGDWIIHKGPALRTVRFDDASLHVDVAASHGVIGYVQEPALHATYVHLDGAAEARIRLAQHAPVTPYLERATGFVDALRFAARRIEIGTHGIGRRDFVLAGLTPGQHWRLGGSELIVDGGGRLGVHAPAGRGARVIALERT